MNYKINHIPVGKIRPGTKMTAEFITIHSTGNEKSTALNERNWLTNPSNNRIASWHIVVDEKEAIEAIPLNEIAYHAGNKKGNNTSISIEMCESGNRAKVIQNTVELVAKMLYERGWGADKLKRHYDWSGKICPRIMSNNNWEGWRGFVITVERELNKLKAGEKSKVNHEPSNWAKKEWEWAKNKGLLDGKRPKEPITREEMAIVLYRLKEGKIIC
jgi:N-acetylmuramoyl-L-alanine amidase